MKRETWYQTKPGSEAKPKSVIRDGESKGKARCWQEGVTYRIRCNTCPQGEAVYIGESASTAYVRGEEHLNQLDYHQRNLEAGRSSVLGRHQRDHHNGDHNTNFTMEVNSHHLAQPHIRQVTESVMIENSESSSLINTRGEKTSDIVASGSVRVRRARPAV